jgi:hypothetical protein
VLLALQLVPRVLGEFVTKMLDHLIVKFMLLGLIGVMCAMMDTMLIMGFVSFAMRNVLLVTLMKGALVVCLD